MRGLVVSVDHLIWRSIRLDASPFCLIVFDPTQPGRLSRKQLESEWSWKKFSKRWACPFTRLTSRDSHSFYLTDSTAAMSFSNTAEQRLSLPRKVLGVGCGQNKFPWAVRIDSNPLAQADVISRSWFTSLSFCWQRIWRDNFVVMLLNTSRMWWLLWQSFTGLESLTAA